MLPLPSVLMSMAGLDPKTVFSSLMDRKGSVTGKTWGNWLEGKSRSRRTTIRRFYEFVAANSISDDSRSLIVDKIEQQMQKTEAKEEYPFFLEWGLFLIGVKLNAPSHLELFMGLTQITQFWGYHGTYAQEPT